MDRGVVNIAHANVMACVTVSRLEELAASIAGNAPEFHCPEARVAEEQGVAFLGQHRRDWS